MTQPMPVVRQIYWPAMFPQFLAIGLLTAGVAVCAPRLAVTQMVFVGATIYLVFCRSLRAIFVGDHRRGMAAYRAGRMEEAIEHFEASHRFFCAHPRLDAWRSFLLGVASYNSYRVIALGNMAYCQGQLGNKEKAIELYEQVLREMPDHVLARHMLVMLKGPMLPANSAPG